LITKIRIEDAASTVETHQHNFIAAEGAAAIARAM
jgi:hypothetical protein